MVEVSVPAAPVALKRPRTQRCLSTTNNNLFLTVGQKHITKNSLTGKLVYLMRSLFDANTIRYIGVKFHVGRLLSAMGKNKIIQKDRLPIQVQWKADG